MMSLNEALSKGEEDTNSESTAFGISRQRLTELNEVTPALKNSTKASNSKFSSQRNSGRWSRKAALNVSPRP